MTKKQAMKYCVKCAKRDNCTVPCAPVEALLSQVSTRPEHDRELPKEFVRQYIANMQWPEPRSSKKRLILELFFLDGREQKDIPFIVGTDRHYVSRVLCTEKKRIRSCINSTLLYKKTASKKM